MKVCPGGDIRIRERCITRKLIVSRASTAFCSAPAQYASENFILLNGIIVEKGIIADDLNYNTVYQ